MNGRQIGVDLDAMEQTPAVLFSKRVRSMCASSGIKAEPAHMYKLTGLSRQVCHKYLNAGTSIEAIPASYLFLLAEKFRCSVRWLYLGDGAPWFSIARTDEENEVLKTMRAVPEKSREHILEAARGELAKSKIAPDTGRFSPPLPSISPPQHKNKI